MDLTKLGWNADLNQMFAPHQAKGLVPARVAAEDKHFFRVWTAEAELLAQVTGKCLHEARGSNAKLPKVGDRVAARFVASEEKAMIQAVLPRRTQSGVKPRALNSMFPDDTRINTADLCDNGQRVSHREHFIRHF